MTPPCVLHEINFQSIFNSPILNLDQSWKQQSAKIVAGDIICAMGKANMYLHTVRKIQFDIQLLDYAIPAPAAPAPAPSPKKTRYGVSPCYCVSPSYGISP